MLLPQEMFTSPPESFYSCALQVDNSLVNYRLLEPESKESSNQEAVDTPNIYKCAARDYEYRETVASLKKGVVNAILKKAKVSPNRCIVLDRLM